MSVYIKKINSSDTTYLVFFEPGALIKPLLVMTETELIERLKELEIWPL